MANPIMVYRIYKMLFCDFLTYDILELHCRKINNLYGFFVILNAALVIMGAAKNLTSL